MPMDLLLVRLMEHCRTASFPPMAGTKERCRACSTPNALFPTASGTQLLSLAFPMAHR